MCGIAGAGTDLLHLGVDGTGVDGEDVDVVGVGLDDLFSDRSRIEDHGELRGVMCVSACRFEDEVGQHADAHLGSAVQLDGTQLGVVELFHRSEMNVLPSQPLRQTSTSQRHAPRQRIRSESEPRYRRVVASNVDVGLTCISLDSKMILGADVLGNLDVFLIRG